MRAKNVRTSPKKGNAPTQLCTNMQTFAKSHVDCVVSACILLICTKQKEYVPTQTENSSAELLHPFPWDARSMTFANRGSSSGNEFGVKLWAVYWTAKNTREKVALWNLLHCWALSFESSRLSDEVYLWLALNVMLLFYRNKMLFDIQQHTSDSHLRKGQKIAFVLCCIFDVCHLFGKKFSQKSLQQWSTGTQIWEQRKAASQKEWWMTSARNM